jgi:alpha-N-arabinofuranosidase
MKQIIALILAVLFTSQFSFGQVEPNGASGYTNPIIPGFHPDPSVCRVGDDYYLVTSSFEYFPGIPIFHSKDLIHWQQIGHCLTRKSQLDLSNTGIWSGVWAPTIRFHRGKFYMITTNVTNGGNFYVTATKPEGPWSEPIWVDNERFDPSLLFDDDGKVYYTRRGITGIVQAEIDIETGKLLTPLKLVSDGYLSPDTEGPHLYKINGWYYLLTAEGGTRTLHMVNIGRSKSPWGPFEPCPKNPILSEHYNYQVIRSAGHGELIEAHDGSWWMVFLATRHYNYDATSFIGRETFLAPVQWVDGWPLPNASVTKDLTVRTKTLTKAPVVIPANRDEFDQTTLQSYWNFLRNPLEDCWSLTDIPGTLVLKGNQNSLNDIASPAWVGRRQEHFNCMVEAKLSFTATADNEEAGLTIYQNFQHHYDFALTRRKDIQALIIRKTIGDIVSESVTIPLVGEQIFLKIHGNKDLYIFSYSLDGQKFQEAGTAIPQYLGTELASSFTGVYFAMYATGIGKDCKNKSMFDYFEYNNTDHRK